MTGKDHGGITQVNHLTNIGGYSESQNLEGQNNVVEDYQVSYRNNDKPIIVRQRPQNQQNIVRHYQELNMNKNKECEYDNGYIPSPSRDYLNNPIQALRTQNDYGAYNNSISTKIINIRTKPASSPHFAYNPKETDVVKKYSKVKNLKATPNSNLRSKNPNINKTEVDSKNEIINKYKISRTNPMSNRTQENGTKEALINKYKNNLKSTRNIITKENDNKENDNLELNNTEPNKYKKSVEEIINTHSKRSSQTRILRSGDSKNYKKVDEEKENDQEI